MPKKLDKCVKKLIQEGRTKSSAYAICTKSIGNDAVLTGENKIDPNTGFMHTPVVICRSGIQGYLGRELGLTGNDAQKIFNVLRHPDDVTDPRSEEHTSELQSPDHLVCRLLLEKKKQ